ncbi:MAG TPA: HAD family phosphatase [Acidimicrobiales bacterium]|nr:HAD family phosphatase [Acidimicrobiales bacterium]
MRTVVFDVGGVLVDWDPRHLYRKVFDSDEEMEGFLAEVCTWEWHHRHDAGVPFAESIPALTAAFPEHADLIAMWETRYGEMIPGEIPGTADVVRDLHAADHRLLVLSNMPSEVWTPLIERFDWFSLFDGWVVSGHEKIVKPDPAIYRILIERFDVDPAASVFIDDRQENVDAAAALGFEAVLFTDAESLRRSLGV